MSVSILEALQNAQYNLESVPVVGPKIAKIQLRNAVKALEAGLNLHDNLDDFLESQDN